MLLEIAWLPRWWGSGKGFEVDASRPVLRSVINAEDFNSVFSNLIDENVGPSGKNQFSRAWYPTLATAVGEIFQCVACIKDRLCNFSCCGWVVAANSASDAL